MATRDLHSNIELRQVLAAQTVSTTQTTSSVDGQGFDSVEFIASVGSIANIANSPTPSWTFKLQHSDDDSTFADVTNSDYVLTGSAASPVSAPDSSSGVFLTLDAASEDASSYRVGYAGPKRYSRMVATAADSPGNTPMAVVVLLSHPALVPTADT